MPYRTTGTNEAGADNEENSKGEAKVINVDGKLAGAYRDKNDKLPIVDITGCKLHWNDTLFSARE